MGSYSIRFLEGNASLDEMALEMEAAEERDAVWRMADWSDGEGDPDPDPKPPLAGVMKFPGFLLMSDATLIDVIADPFVMPGETEEEIVCEATTELLRRMDARGNGVAPRRNAA